MPIGGSRAGRAACTGTRVLRAASIAQCPHIVPRIAF